MEKAALLAGMPEGKIRLILEPEDAAIYGLRKQVNQGILKAGECVVICDAGGGTVDVVAHHVQSEDHFSLDQVTISQGDFCGSQFINQEFMNQIALKLGDDFNRLAPKNRSKIERKFEHDIKRTFNPEKPKSYYISVGDLSDDNHRHIHNSKMMVDNATVRMSFESITTQIMTLIEGKIEKLASMGLESKMNGILLVGGFSESVREEFAKVWRVDKGWTAVVKGAAAHEIGRSLTRTVIRNRLSAYNYGIPYIQGDIRSVHWLVRKGQPVRAGILTESYVLRLDDEPWLDQLENCHIQVTVVRSDKNEAPDEYTDRVTLHRSYTPSFQLSIIFDPQAAQESMAYPGYPRTASGRSDYFFPLLDQRQQCRDCSRVVS